MAVTAAGRRLIERHPLQRLQSPSRDESAILHLVGLISFGFSFGHLFVYPSPANESYGWHLQYLTIIGLSLATITFALALLADLTLSRRIFRWKSSLSVASAPMECLITLLYWSLKFLDPKLVTPEWSPPMALGTDMTFHLIPAVALVIDLLFFSPPYSIAFLPALGLSGCIAFGYWFWIEQCFYYNKFYPYPIFAILNTTQRVGLFAFSALLMAISTAALIWLYNMVNGPEGRQLLRGDVTKARSGNVKGQSTEPKRQFEDNKHNWHRRVMIPFSIWSDTV